MNAVQKYIELRNNTSRVCFPFSVLMVNLRNYAHMEFWNDRLISFLTFMFLFCLSSYMQFLFT